jgi:hypothetical protein
LCEVHESTVFFGAQYAIKAIVKGVVLLSRAAAQSCVEYTSGLLKDLVIGAAKGMLGTNQFEIGKINEQLVTT